MRRTVLLCFLTAVFFETTSAERLSFKYYSSSDGLVSDNVNRIVPDSRGFLWLCTDDGLSRFDGYEFKNYTQDSGLPSRSVNDLFEASDGTYLIATSGGLAVFDPHGKAYRWNILTGTLEQTGSEPAMFKTYFPPADASTKIPKSILSVAQAQDGQIYVGTFHGLFRFQRNKDEWEFSKVEFADWDDRSIDFNTLFADTKGGFWIITSVALYRMSAGGTIEKVNDLGGNTIFEDRSGRVWIDGGGNPIGIRVYTFSDGSDTPTLSHTYTKRDGLPDDVFTNAIGQTSDGRIFASANGKLCEFIENANENEPKFRRLQDDVVNTGSGAVDKSGNLWMGVAGKGAWKYSPNSFAIFDEHDGLSNERIVSIFGNESGDVFFIAGNQQITRVNGDSYENVVPFGRSATRRGESFTGFPSGGDWWIAADDELRHYLRVKAFPDLKRTSPAVVFSKAAGFPGTYIMGMFEDSRGDVWFGVDYSGASVFRWEKATGKVDRYVNLGGLTASDGAVSYGEDSAGNVWIGFYLGGLVRYKDGQFRLFSASDGFPGGSVSTMYGDREGRLWLAMASRGLVRIDDPNSEAPVFTNISTTGGLSSNQTFCVSEDNFGRIYVGTGHGISRLDPETQKIKIYTQADGLPNNYISRCFADKKGDMWFASNNSLIRFAPTVEHETPAPPIFVGGMSVNGIARPVSELGETDIEGVELDPDQRQIQIRFFGLSFSAGDNLRYQYKLEGQDWSVPDVQKSIAFNLAAGSYEIAVRAVSSDGVVSEKPATVKFRIQRPFWQRGWFIALSFLFAGGVVFTIFRSRDAKRKQIERAREERLAELQRVRTRIANDLHDDIGSSLTQIAVLSEVARGQAGTAEKDKLDLPLERIRNVSKELVASMSDVVWAINPNKDFLHDLVQRMRRFASDVFTGRDIKFDFRTPDDEQNLTLGANTRREVLAIFKEAVNNIVKYSECSLATIDFQIRGEQLVLEISDDGEGFDTGHVLTDDFSPEQGGNGLVNIQKRAKELGGTCEIVSAPGQGTRITVEIPL